ncbi:MAG TPA: tripartite tricarboxylate transporter substrate binding protein [Burkholderiales bacterium]|nr:tripartite tricarboxylate transporter substrate binding protein [Burkholderiales bacterium]
MKLRRALGVLLCAAGGSWVSAHAQTAATGSGQAYPVKTVRVVVPFAAGGGTDSLARVVGQKLQESLGQSFVVDNRPGAGGTIGSEIAARAAADGYTLLAVNAGHVINPHLYKSLPYDTIASFAPVALWGTASYVLVVHPSLPAKSVKELIALARARSDLTFASSGNASTTHLAAELFNHMAKTKMTHVPYKGGGPANTALVAGEVSCYFGSIGGSLPHIRSGRLRTLAVTGGKRSSALPGVPTIAESGLPGYDITGWFGMLAPAGTPQDVVGALNRETNRALQQPDVKKRLLEAEGADPAPLSPHELAQFIGAELKKYAQVVRTSGARVD